MQKLTFDDFVGNEQAIEKVKLLIHKGEGDNFARIPDMAFLGPSGHGKTTLAQIVAHHLGRAYVEINSTVIRDPFQFRGYVVNPDLTNKGAIVLLDECHQLKRKIQDNLLSALENPRELHTSHKENIFKDKLPENLSFIFATTHAGAIRPTLRSRLENVEILEYSLDEKKIMVVKYLGRAYNITSVGEDQVESIARRSRDGRHIVKNVDNLVRLLEKENVSEVTDELVDRTFEILGIDKFGLTRVDRKLLGFLAEANTYVGLDTLEAAMNVTKKEIRENLEPWLLREQFIVRSSSGRLITKKGSAALRKANNGQRPVA